MSGIHIYVATGTRFIGQVRFFGHRRWITAGPNRIKKATALQDMVRKFKTGNYKRGRVIMIADWYDPEIVTEMQNV